MHRSRKPRGTVMRNVRRQGARPEMADEQMVELYLDVAEACHREAGIAIERVIGLGIVITTLAQEHQRDPEGLAKLYSLARLVHYSPSGRWKNISSDLTPGRQC